MPDRREADKSSKKFRDFDIKYGFNDTGAISAKIKVPYHMRGRVIGKRGATRQAIEAETGARLSLDDESDYALIIGQPAHVQAAARRVERICDG